VLIDLDPRTGEHSLREADDFTAFAIVLPSAEDLPLRPGTVPDSLGDVTDDGEHVVVHRNALRALAGPITRSEDWQAGFDAMLAYAKHSGWLTPDGSGIRAHCTVEAPPEEQPAGP
jgi:hypothetical protein